MAPHRAGPPLPECSIMPEPAASRRDVEVGLLCPITGFGSLNKLWEPGSASVCLSLYPVANLSSLTSKKMVSTKLSDMLLIGNHCYDARR